jgi:hypothetical protein
MLQLPHGDILKADADALVNMVNCVGYPGHDLRDLTGHEDMKTT